MFQSMSKLAIGRNEGKYECRPESSSLPLFHGVSQDTIKQGKGIDCLFPQSTHANAIR